ncbi:tight adherence protein C [Microbacterium keratanolyticum]|uniref:Pilus assembly protein TadB n=1 Tax=Microbacterium keratanolyticum TaxID=67574 RepID=A0A9W6HSE4_9MICO|nr:type II secretion system F family protein [Microbacterium keratanolyticum]MBM7469957.1 tight adherence protein C [Microbacterium keratanolyticum]GLK02036.1 pilus assembly protein TadB [Microbacterium keratanolyticum]
MNPTSALAVSTLLGGLLGAGAFLLLSALPRWRALPLTVRIAPHLRDVTGETDQPRLWSARMPTTAGARWADIAHRLLDVIGAGGGTVPLRLSQAGVDRTLASFRGRQLGWAVAGVAVGAIGTIVLALAGRMSLPAVLLPVVTGAVAGVIYDYLLSMRAKARVARLSEELPTVLEFFALCLSARETPLDALRRVASTGSGELSQELRLVVLAVHTGSGLGEAFGESAQRLQIPAYSRVVDQLVAALERGAPLAAVLQAQASDAREESKRGLIESAGRKEILMLLPLVFLILPLSVIFAVFPGMFILRLGLS